MLNVLLRRGRKIMSIRRTDAGKWRATVYLSKRKGRRKNVTKTFDSLRDAKLWEAQTRSDVLKGEKRVKLSEFSTLNALIDAYLKSIITRVSPSTYTNYQNKLQAHISEELGPLQVNTLNIEKIEEFKENLLSVGLEKKNINYILGVLSNVFEYGINMGPQLDIKNPVKGVYRFKIQKDIKEIKYIEDTGPLLKASEGNHYEPLILLLLNTGMRISEGCALQVKAFDKRRGVLKVSQQFHPYIKRENEPILKGAFILGPLKGSEARSIPLNKKMIDLLTEITKEKPQTEFIFSPLRKTERDLRPIVFKRGKKPKVEMLHVVNPKSTGFSREVLQPLMESVGLYGLSVHNLRDTFATHFYDVTRDLNALRKILGHKKISTTQVYADIFETKAKEYVDKVIF